jgi:hypothetical protein
MSNLARPGSAAYAALFRYALRMNSRYWKVLGDGNEYTNQCGVTFCFTGHALDAVYSPVGDKMNVTVPRANLKRFGPVGFFFMYRDKMKTELDHECGYEEREDYE